MISISRQLPLILLSAGLLLGSSCVGPRSQPVSGASNEKYWLGTYSANFNSSLFLLDKAVRAACKRAKLIEVQRINKANSCIYHYKDVDQVKTKIEVVEKSLENCRVNIHVGQTGCKVSSQQLLLAIDDELRILQNSQY